MRSDEEDERIFRRSMRALRLIKIMDWTALIVGASVLLVTIVWRLS